jgi:flagellar basal-body rod protein FlgF
MLYGLYLSAQGAQAQGTRLDVLSNNLANASTSGFKRDLAIFQSHRPYDVENGGTSDAPANQSALSGGVTPAKVVTDFSNGPVVHTGGSLDVALSGSGFFQVSDGAQQFLTRKGQFALNAAGDLVLQNSGLHVLSSSGVPINVPAEATQLEIGGDGTLSTVGSDGSRTQVARLGLVRPASEQQLEKVGSSLFRTNAPVSPAGNDLQLEQGFVEQSTTQPVSEMIELIQASRMVEANVNMIKFQDDALDRLLQSATPH